MYSSEVLELYPVLLADEFKSSENTHNAMFTKILSKQAFFANNCRCLASDAYILFSHLIFQILNKLGFVL